MENNIDLNLISGVVNADDTNEHHEALCTTKCQTVTEMHPESSTGSIQAPIPQAVAKTVHESNATTIPNHVSTTHPTEGDNDKKAVETEPKQHTMRQTVPNFLSDIRPDFWDRF